MQYQGQILDGQMHGVGKLTYENGEYYDGDWVRGRGSRCSYVICRMSFVAGLFLISVSLAHPT
jgi:hypothetical protein